jgi:hypothetical protein
MHRPKSPEVFERPKVFLRDIPGDRGLVATVDASGVYSDHTLNCVVPKWAIHGARPDVHFPPSDLDLSRLYSLGYLVAVVNARPCTFTYKMLLGDGLHVPPEVVRALPVPRLDFLHTTPLAEEERLLQDCRATLDAGDYETPLRLAEQAMATHALLFGPAGRPELREDPYWQAVVARANPDFPGREDFVHDLLAALAERMMDLNRRKHEEAARFLGWLEWYTGCSVEQLAGKTLVQRFYEHPEPKGLLDVLAKSKKRLSKPLGAALVADVSREHKQAVATITPILEALQQTDRLIDLIVYRLCGLSEEDIAVVEGHAGETAG